MEQIQNFMHIYMYELEKFLLKNKEKIKNLSFQLDEANTDRPLKEFLKTLIETKFSKIPTETKINKIQLNDKTINNTSELKDIIILRVLLKEDITEEIKEKIKLTKSSSYTTPDICFEILMKGKKYYESVELKSTKTDAIPGSSVQQIIPEEWVIFIKHSAENIDITTGQYIHAVNSKMPFPDRSPRPQVSFKEIQNWNKLNRITDDKKLVYKTDKEEASKQELIKDWKEVLVNNWINIIFKTDKSKNKEPWFNDVLRKFVLAFIEKYNSLSDEEKSDFIKNLKSSNIDD